MSMPLMCEVCGDIIGTLDGMGLAMASRRGMVDSRWPVFSCPGYGNHPKPVRAEEPRFFGWLKKIIQRYPETSTSSSWYEYIGPRNRVAIWLAIHLGTRVPTPIWRTSLFSLLSGGGGGYFGMENRAEGVVIDGKWVRPDGLFGLAR